MTAGKVLVVEDEPDLREILIYNLKREGFTVYASGDGWESLLIAQREKPDVVLLDLMLPTMDGLEVCRKLRAQASYGVHVIIVSALKQEEDILRGLELGADDYVGKPFSLKELVAASSRRNHAPQPRRDHFSPATLSEYGQPRSAPRGYPDSTHGHRVSSPAPFDEPTGKDFQSSANVGSGR